MRNPPDTSWIVMECICCPGYEHHVSRWRKLRDRLDRDAERPIELLDEEEE